MLDKLNSAWSPADYDADKEIITEEERECFRNIGQKMDSSLLLGKEKAHFQVALSTSISPLAVRVFVLDTPKF